MAQDFLWDQRADAYRESETHARGPDLDRLIELCEPGPDVSALDVATGGGHVARRLAEAGCAVTTADASVAMQPDVVCAAESLPFQDGRFELVVSRVAAHHFEDVAAAVHEMARVARDRVVVQDLVYRGESVEEAERLRDPSHVRSYSDEEWRSLFDGAGLDVDVVECMDKALPIDDWLDRTGCGGAAAARVRALLEPLTDGGAWTTSMILLRGRRT